MLVKSRLQPRLVRQSGILLASLLAAVITACGGGGDDPAVSSTPVTESATAFAAGPISGFGSVIVNGVRYDDTAASVSDDDGRARSRDLLKLGMMVEVDGSTVDTKAATGKALRIRYGSEIVGPVTAVNATAGTLSVLGQTVTVTDTTVFDSSLTGGIASLDTSDIVEVHAQYNATDGSFTATRIEDAAAATTYKLRGTVASLDTTAKTFALGGQVINYASLAAVDVPSDLANGITVHVRLQTTKVNGQWVATAVRSTARKVADGLVSHLRGPITVFTSATNFEINGLKVDATGASFPDGTAAIVLGAVVEVRGTVTNSVLVATSVELDDRHARERHPLRLHGTLSSLDTVAKTFVLRGVTVSYAGTVTWTNGTEATLANGKAVAVKGTPSADRTQLVATAITFE